MTSRKRHHLPKIIIKEHDGNILEEISNKSKYYGFGVFLAYSVLYTDKINFIYNKEDLTKMIDFAVVYKSQNNLKIYPNYLPNQEYFNWWIWLGDISFCGDRIYSVVEFENTETVIGFIKTLQNNQVDFRNVTSWAPYTTDKNKNIIPLDIDGYDLDYYNPSLPIQYTIIPYST